MSNDKIIAEAHKVLKAQSKGNWKTAIAEQLKKKSMTAVELYKATRTETIPEAKMKHNIASQITYLRDDNYAIDNDNGTFVLVLGPDGKIYDEPRVVKRLPKATVTELKALPVNK